MNIRMVAFVFAALALAGCDSGKITLDSAIKKARDANSDVAISQYQHLITNDPNNPMYYNNLGCVFFRNGQFAKAKEHVQKSAELDFEGTLSDAIAHNLEMIAEYDSARKTICVDLKDRTNIAYFRNEEKFEVKFRYSANEIGYLLLVECYQGLHDPERASLAYQKLLALYEHKKFDSALKSRADSILNKG